MKKRIMGILLAVLIFSAAPVYADDTAVRVFVNDKEIVNDYSAVLRNGVTYIPFRPILNALGVTDEEIVWHQDTSSLEIRTEERYIFMAIGNAGVVVDKTMITLTGAPFICENRTYIPVRGVSEILGAGVEWNGLKKEVYITKAD